MKMQLLKITSSIACLSFLMSATKCEQPVAETRQLKKNIRVMQVSAATYLDNSGFNFSETAQSQLSGVLFSDNNFYERTQYPVLVSSEGRTRMHIDKASLEKVQSWFPSSKTQEVEFSKESACLISRPQHFIAGKINALEAYGGGSLKLGFSQAAAPVIPVSAEVKIDTMRMDISFQAFDPWTQQIVGAVNEPVFKKDYAVGFGIDVSIFHIGPQFYRTMGMAETTLKGLQANLKKLADQLLLNPGEQWSTRVVYSRDNYVALLGGSELGIKKGDQFKIYNQTHNWIGEPCGDSSILVGSITTSGEPWIVEVEGEDDKGLTRARVLNPQENVSINTGALVKLHQFVQPPPPPKK